ncbi:MAG: DNA-3-methyladenine glycosylase I [Nanoarchaeota archaeon]
MAEKIRCSWAGNDSLMVRYHDLEWGKPVHDDKKLFEFLVLESAQAGLSWATILKKRENYRKSFNNFDYKKIAEYTQEDVKELLANEGIIRNKLKIHSAIRNAKAFIEIQKEYGSFDRYIWSFVGNKPIKSSFKSLKEIPASTGLSGRISKDLKKRGMNFVGSTIIYAFMQAVGMVNDHTTGCFRRKS